MSAEIITLNKSPDQGISVPYIPLSSKRDLKKVISPLGLGVHASADVLYRGANFMRDTVKVARDVNDPGIIEETIVTGVELQAYGNNDATDSKRGELPHEHRSEVILDRLDLNKVDKESSKEILDNLYRRWGGKRDIKKGKSISYYGGKDATPEWIGLVSQYQKASPKADILNKSPKDFVEKGRPLYVEKRQDTTVAESMIRALRSVVKDISNSDLALREYQRKNPLGIKNQYWKDSATSLLFENGKSVNHRTPIAEIGIQGITYDALKMSAKTMSPEDVKKIVSDRYIKRILGKESVQSLFTEDELIKMYTHFQTGEENGLDIVAKIVQKQTLKRFWTEDSENPEKGYFASATDRDPKDPSNKTYRVVDTVSSNAGMLLKSTIFDDLPEKDRQKYVSNITSVLMGPEFLTDVGVRGRAVRYIDLIKFRDYHGAGVVWPKEASDIAQGLRHQGLYGLAQELEKRIINSVNIAGSHYEFFYVDADGKVNFDPHGLRSDLSKVAVEKRVIYGTNIPEDTQAWTISSSYRAKREQGKLLKQKTEPSSWQAELENDLLPKIPSVKLLKTHKEIQDAYPNNCIYSIDTAKGQAYDLEFNEAWWNEEMKTSLR